MRSTAAVVVPDQEYWYWQDGIYKLRPQHASGLYPLETDWGAPLIHRAICPAYWSAGGGLRAVGCWCSGFSSCLARTLRCVFEAVSYFMAYVRAQIYIHRIYVAHATGYPPQPLGKSCPGLGYIYMRQVFAGRTRWFPDLRRWGLPPPPRTPPRYR